MAASSQFGPMGEGDRRAYVKEHLKDLAEDAQALICRGGGPESSFGAAGGSGVGKSTIGNIILYNKMSPKTGLKVSGQAESCTKTLKTRRSDDGKREFKDVPGIPDTDPLMTKQYYDLVVNMAKSPLSALLFVFQYGRINVSNYKQAALLFREIKRATCPKILVINDMIDRSKVADESSDDDNPSPKDADFIKVANLIREETGIDFDLVVVVKNKHDMKDVINGLITDTFSDVPPTPSPHLKSYADLQKMVESLGDAEAMKRQVQNDRLEEIKSLMQVQDLHIAAAATTAAVALAATTASFVTFGFTLGIAGYTSMVSAGVISKALYEKNTLLRLQQEVENDEVLEQLAQELNEAVAQFKQLEDDISKTSPAP